MFQVKIKYNITSFLCFFCWLLPESVYQYSVSTFTFEQVFISRVWKTSHNNLKTQKATYLFCNKCCKAYFIQQFIIVSNGNKVWTNEDTMNTLKDLRKLCYGACVWVKILAIVVARRRKIKKKPRLKCPKAVPKNKIWAKI